MYVCASLGTYLCSLHPVLVGVVEISGIIGLGIASMQN